MITVSGTTRDFESQIAEVVLDSTAYFGGIGVGISATVDLPFIGTMPLEPIEEEALMLEGYRACASLEMQIIKEFEIVDRENF